MTINEYTSLLGAINTEIEVKRQRGDVGTATITKRRDGADGTEFAFDLERVLLGHDDEDDEVSSCVAICANSADVPKKSRSKKLPRRPAGGSQCPDEGAR